LADDYGIQGLNGKEIIDDLLAQLRSKLEGDCSLRPHDSYSRGYSAKITYDVKCYGLDQETVTGEFTSGKELEESIEGGGEGEMEIPQEVNLAEVRDRIKDATDGPSEEEEGTEEVPTGEGIRQKRKYTRKVKLASPGVIGGAEDFQE
jgi:hypothetical protein